MFSRRKGRCCITATRRSSNAPLNPPVVSFAASSNNSPVSPATHPRIPPRKPLFLSRPGPGVGPYADEDLRSPSLPAQVILNGHQFVACQAGKLGIDFTKEGNCFTQIGD